MGKGAVAVRLLSGLDAALVAVVPWTLALDGGGEGGFLWLYLGVALGLACAFVAGRLRSHWLLAMGPALVLVASALLRHGLRAAPGSLVLFGASVAVAFVALATWRLAERSARAAAT